MSGKIKKRQQRKDNSLEGAGSKQDSMNNEIQASMMTNIQENTLSRQSVDEREKNLGTTLVRDDAVQFTTQKDGESARKSKVEDLFSSALNSTCKLAESTPPDLSTLNIDNQKSYMANVSIDGRKDDSYSIIFRKTTLVPIDDRTILSQLIEDAKKMTHREANRYIRLHQPVNILQYPNTSLRYFPVEFDRFTKVMYCFEDLQLIRGLKPCYKVSSYEDLERDVEELLIKRFNLSEPGLVRIPVNISTEGLDTRLYSAVGLTREIITKELIDVNEKAALRNSVSVRSLSLEVMRTIGSVYRTPPYYDYVAIADGFIQMTAVEWKELHTYECLHPLNDLRRELERSVETGKRLIPLSEEQIERTMYYKPPENISPTYDAAVGYLLREGLSSLMLRILCELACPTLEADSPDTIASSLVPSVGVFTTAGSSAISSAILKIKTSSAQRFFLVYAISCILPDVVIELVPVTLSPDVALIVATMILCIFPENQLTQGSAIILQRYLRSGLVGRDSSGVIDSQGMDITIVLNVMQERVFGQLYDFLPIRRRSFTLPPTKDTLGNRVEALRTYRIPFNMDTDASSVTKLRQYNLTDWTRQLSGKDGSRLASIIQLMLSRVCNTIEMISPAMHAAIAKLACSIPQDWVDVRQTISLNPMEVFSGLMMSKSLIYQDLEYVDPLINLIQTEINRFIGSLLPCLSSLLKIYNRPEVLIEQAPLLAKKIIEKLEDKSKKLFSLMMYDSNKSISKMAELLQHLSRIVPNDLPLPAYMEEMRRFSNILAKHYICSPGMATFVVVSPRDLKSPSKRSDGEVVEDPFKWFIKRQEVPVDFEDYSIEKVQTFTAEELRILFSNGVVINGYFPYEILVGSTLSRPEVEVKLSRERPLEIHVKSIPICATREIDTIEAFLSDRIKYGDYYYVSYPVNFFIDLERVPIKGIRFTNNNLLLDTPDMGWEVLPDYAC
uniref:Uncharacterized protein n=1 Tax=Hubei blood fluke virus 3 TaxID=1922841 RepID=A0A1L3KP30_9VIRU|nr:hypothetical protein 1 [Hubei blood fluke virus 3]